VIIAAGCSRRFGQPKQLQNITENGNWLMDFAVYDALRLGLQQVVFIVSKDQQQIIKQHYEPLSQKIHMNALVQQQDPAGFEKNQTTYTAKNLGNRTGSACYSQNGAP
jgi:CTP:molybdopterin cytidylyltransferase MocA